MSNADKLTENCIHCGLCTRKCAFLQKYKLDLQSFAEHPELFNEKYFTEPAEYIMENGLCLEEYLDSVGIEY